MSELMRTPVVIATEINSIKGQTQAMMLHASAEIGKRLVEVKELLPHGEWGNWLKSNVEYSQSTANNLMQIHQEYSSNPKAFGNLSYSKAVALLGLEADEREVFIQENDVENLSTRKLQKVIREKQKLEKQLEKIEASAVKEREKLEKNIQRLESQLEDAKTSETDEHVLKQLQEELAASQSKVKKLEKDLKAKPIEASASVEVIPEDVEKELEELRAKIAEQGDPSEVKFKLRFEALVVEFRSTLEALNGISDSEVREKYKGAVSGLINKMNGSL